MLYYFGMIFAGIGAGAILFALAAISAVIGGLLVRPRIPSVPK